MAKYDWKVEPRDEDWSDDTYGYFLIHINLKRMAEYLTKEFKKDWWFKADYGQDNCYIVAENHNFPVRLFFTFDEGGWADITRHYTDGATYTNDHLGSWHFAKYDVDYSYKVISSNIEDYFNKFEESMKKETKSIKESKTIYVIEHWHPLFDETHYVIADDLDAETTDETDINNALKFDSEKDAKKWIKDHDKLYGGKLKIHEIELKESKKENKNMKSIKEYRTVGFEQLVRDTIVSILENPESYNSDLFDLGMCSEVIMTYDNKGRARIRNDGSVEIDYLTLPTYAWSSGYTPKNKKLAKLFDDMNESNMEMAKERLWDENKDELIELGITDKDDERLNYNDLYDMGAGDLAEELSEYEMDLEGMDLYTDVYCELEETDEGIELTITMTVDDEYGHALVKDYKPNTVVLDENKLQDEGDLTEVIEKAIREVTEQF